MGALLYELNKTWGDTDDFLDALHLAHYQRRVLELYIGDLKANLTDVENSLTEMKKIPDHNPATYVVVRMSSEKDRELLSDYLTHYLGAELRFPDVVSDPSEVPYEGA